MASIVGGPSGALVPGHARTGLERGRTLATVWIPGANPLNVLRGRRGIVSVDGAWLRRTHRLGRGDAMTAAAPSGVVTFCSPILRVRPVGGSPTRNRCGRRCWEYIR